MFKLRIQMAKTIKAINDYCFAHPECGNTLGGPFLEALTDTELKQKALEALEDAGCLKTLVADNELLYLRRTRKSSLYLLQRQELWFNRIVAFAAGVTSSLIVEAIIRAIA